MDRQRTKRLYWKKLVGGRKLWNSVVARKLRYLGHIMRKEDENLEKCIISGMFELTRGRGKPRRARSDDFKEWTNLSIEEIPAVDEGRIVQLGAWRECGLSCRQCSHQRMRHQRVRR